MGSIKGKMAVKKMAINYIGGGKSFTQSCSYFVLLVITDYTGSRIKDCQLISDSRLIRLIKIINVIIRSAMPGFVIGVFV